MSEMKHTPGPWAHESKKGPHNVEGTVSSMGVFSVSRFNDLMEEEDADECDAIDASWVCGIWGEISDEDEANARLIAAAPELLEAAKWTVHHQCEGFCKDLPHADTYTNKMDHDCAACRSRVAIAKAEVKL